MKSKNVCCRACGEYDTLGYTGPDMVVSDGKFTCWNCRTNPYRKHKGLSTNLEVKKFNKYYNLESDD